MKRTMAFECIDEVLVVVHGVEHPSDEEWSIWLHRMGDHDYKAVLILTDGGAPTPKQRAMTNAFWTGKAKPKMAVVSDSALVRGAIFAFYWLFKGDMRPFSPHHIKDALDFLEIGAAHASNVQTRAAILHARIKAETLPYTAVA